MKKLLFSISVLLYFAATTGVVINSHYCMKRLVSVDFYKGAPDVCGKCGMDMHETSGCCHDEIKVAKLNADQQKVTIASYEIAAPEIATGIPSSFIAALFQPIIPERHYSNHSPPLLSERDIYLQNRVFRI